MLLRVLPEAAEDIDAAYAWYLPAPPAIRQKLRDEIDAAFARILENPAQFPKIEGEFRRVLLPSFPFGVFYRALIEEAVVVMVFPLREDPALLRQRLTVEAPSLAASPDAGAAFAQSHGTAASSREARRSSR